MASVLTSHHRTYFTEHPSHDIRFCVFFRYIIYNEIIPMQGGVTLLSIVWLLAKMSHLVFGAPGFWTSFFVL